MLDINYINYLQSKAVNVLLDEIFTHINNNMQEQYIALGKKNAQLQNVRDYHFMYAGTVYPPILTTKTPYGRPLPTLHYSLLGELDAINKSIAQADYHYIKNYIVAVVSQSHNAIVLNDLLPAILVNELKDYFTSEEFKVIDTGVYDGLQQEPISVTRQNIQAIKEHYKSTITTIQHLLMDKFLFQK